MTNSSTANRVQYETAIAIPVVPFDRNDEPDAGAYARVIKGMSDGGITALAANGNVGEFYSLSTDEARRIVAITREASTPDAAVIAGVGHDLRTAVQMAREAKAEGASAIMVHQPENPFTSRSGWVDYHLAIADAVPDTDIVIYVRDPRVRANELKALADALPALAAVKYTLPDLFGFVDAVDKVGVDRVAWVCGLAEGWTPFFWIAGARGFTSGIANLAPSLVIEFLAQLREGQLDQAMGTWRHLRKMEELRGVEHGQYSVAVLKEALEQLGISSRSVRPPLSVLPQERRDAVAEIIHDWTQSGVFAPDPANSNKKVGRN